MHKHVYNNRLNNQKEATAVIDSGGQTQQVLPSLLTSNIGTILGK